MVLFDDLSREAERTYGTVLDFLALAPDRRNNFAIANPRKTHAWPALSRLIVKPPRLLQNYKRLARQGFPRLTKGAGRLVHGLLQRPAHRPTIGPALRRRLANELRPDMEKLARLLDRDLAGWTRSD